MIGDVARRRGKKATGEIIAPMAGTARQLACFGSRHGGDACCDRFDGTGPDRQAWARRGRFQLTRDAVAAARKHIYIETQYLASSGVARAIAKRLKDPDGPEIAVVVTKSSHGFIEKLAMGNTRDG